ncbi:MAG: hypothetical protein ACP5N7_03915 [Candidatus Pacearchaeota archaeon]
MVKINPRYTIVKEAEMRFRSFFLDLEKEYSLTFGELFQILSSSMADLSKYLIRVERHPSDPEKKGDEE